MANQINEAVSETGQHAVRKVASFVSIHSVKSMEEALKAAELIRVELSGRAHSDSTELVAADRER